MKVEMEFEEDYATGGVLLKPVSRLHIGDHIGMLMFTPQGKTILCIDEAAAKDGSIVLGKGHTENFVCLK